MAGKEDITYEFEDLRRNTDELPAQVLAALEIDDSDEGKDEEDDAGGGDDANQEELVPMSEVNRRVARVRREADQKLAQARGEVSEVVGDLQKRIGDIEHQGEVDELDEQHEDQLSTLNTKIEEAIEAGDTKEATRLTTELSRITAENVSKRERLKTKRAQDEHDEPTDLNDQRNVQPVVTARAKDWLAEQEWWDDPELSKVKRYVNRLDMVLQERGYKPDEDAFYLELERAIEKKHPGVIIHTMDENEVGNEADDFADIPDRNESRRTRQRRASTRSPASGITDSTGSAGKPANRGGKGKTLNRSQIANMRMFGMDPANKDHVEAYLAEVK